jgi:hypothetical protein
MKLRAALIQLAKSLETQRACVLRILAVLERQAEVKPPVAVVNNVDLAYNSQ